ncbi:rRNA-binding ribosome biosynthesis protein UTP25 [Sporobolomyces salmoneus]|uniref:rRNA-binding ribosome biosynthesis protein UTP25 n=1 Tax=Sporobolomyces salmoneus TaxID=183962 RepID=UPI00317B664C
MVKPMHEQSPSVKLLTILNVQSAKPPKKTSSTTSTSATNNEEEEEQGQKGKKGKEVRTRDWHEIARKVEGKKKNKKLKPSPSTPSAPVAVAAIEEPEQEEITIEKEETAEEEEDSFKSHFGSDSKLVESVSKEDLESEEGGGGGLKWSKKRVVVKGLGECQKFTPRRDTGEEMGQVETKTKDGFGLYAPKLMDKLKSSSPNNTIPTAQSNWLQALSSYQDISYSKLELGEKHEEIRESIALHAMNHVQKTRSRILKNNEYLSKISSNPSLSQPSRITTDQGFTRPKILILTPFRSCALSWLQHLLHYSLVPQIENYERFLGEYSLPSGVVDKLVENRDEYPEDHVETFKGNIDDEFRVGVKVNRKQCKVFAEFYQADLLVASPLGLRTSIEKENDSDFLSSIELVVVDQMDVLLMQNWDHLNFVMERLNKIPEEDHGCDFSRVKPWYLDGKAPFLRQSILLSRYSTPETLSLFSTHLSNQAGKLKTIEHHEGVMDLIPRGLRQVWNRIESGSEGVEGLEDRRFEWFTQKTLPSLMKSAISSQQTIIFVPDYFDFVRLKRYLTKKLDGFSFASISEYTPTPDVSRARGAFFSGKKKFLLITERFHFFRRYRIRGAKTVVFYAPPSHASYYPEFLSFPFKSPGQLPNPNEEDQAQVDESELSAHVVFSKYDLLRMERIVGTGNARRMCGVGEDGGAKEGRFTFV